MAPIYSKTIKDELLSGYPYMPCTLEKAKALERQHNHKGDVQNIVGGTIINSMEKRYKV